MIENQLAKPIIKQIAADSALLIIQINQCLFRYEKVLSVISRFSAEEVLYSAAGTVCIMTQRSHQQPEPPVAHVQRIVSRNPSVFSTEMCHDSKHLTFTDVFFQLPLVIPAADIFPVRHPDDAVKDVRSVFTTVECDIPDADLISG